MAAAEAQDFDGYSQYHPGNIGNPVGRVVLNVLAATAWDSGHYKTSFNGRVDVDAITSDEQWLSLPSGR